MSLFGPRKRIDTDLTQNRYSKKQYSQMMDRLEEDLRSFSQRLEHRFTALLEDKNGLKRLAYNEPDEVRLYYALENIDEIYANKKAEFLRIEFGHRPAALEALIESGKLSIDDVSRIVHTYAIDAAIRHGARTTKELDYLVLYAERMLETQQKLQKRQRKALKAIAFKYLLSDKG